MEDTRRAGFHTRPFGPNVASPFRATGFRRAEARRYVLRFSFYDFAFFFGDAVELVDEVIDLDLLSIR
jgi:hypothetical protein